MKSLKEMGSFWGSKKVLEQLPRALEPCVNNDQNTPWVVKIAALSQVSPKERARFRLMFPHLNEGELEKLRELLQMEHVLITHHEAGGTFLAVNRKLEV